MLALLHGREAADDPATRSSDYAKLTNVLAYIAKQLLAAHSDERITDQELFQAVEFMGSGGWNCFTAYHEVVELMGTQYASILGLDEPKDLSLEGILTSKLESLFRKVFYALSQTLFDSFFEEAVKQKHLKRRSEAAMRIHFRQHFHDRINQDYNLFLPAHSYNDTTTNTAHLKYDEKHYLKKHFHEVFEPTKIYDLVYEHLNDALKNDHIFYENVLDWFKRFHDNSQDIVETLSTHVFKGFSKTLRRSALESLLISTGIVSVVKPTRSGIMRTAFFTEDVQMLVKKKAKTRELKSLCLKHPLKASKLYAVVVFQEEDHLASKLTRANPSVAEDSMKSLFEQKNFNRIMSLMDNGLTPNLTVTHTYGSRSATFSWRESLLSLAVKNNQLDMAKHLIERNAVIQFSEGREWTYDAENQQYYKNRSLLHRAIFSNNLDMVKLLAENGAPLNQVMERFSGSKEKHNDFLTPLALSVTAKDDDIFSYLLLQKGVSLQGVADQVYDTGNRELFLHIVSRGGACDKSLATMAQDRDLALLETLVEAGLSPHTYVPMKFKCGDTTYNWQETLLSLAVSNKAHQLAQSLITARVDLAPTEGERWSYDFDTKQFYKNRSLLHRAVLANDLELVKLLVENGAPLNQVMERFSGSNQKHNDFLTPLALSVTAKDDNIFSYLLQQKRVSLKGVADQVYDTGNRELFLHIVSRGGACDKSLATMAQDRDLALLETLVKMGLSPHTYVPMKFKSGDTTYNWQETLLSLAVSNKAHQFAQSLIKARVDLAPKEGKSWHYDFDTKTFYKNRSLLHRAVLANDLELVKLLVENGAPLNQVMERFSGSNEKHNDFLTPLALSVTAKDDNIFSYLLLQGTSRNPIKLW